MKSSLFLNNDRSISNFIIKYVKFTIEVENITAKLLKALPLIILTPSLLAIFTSINIYHDKSYSNLDYLFVPALLCLPLIFLISVCRKIHSIQGNRSNIEDIIKIVPAAYIDRAGVEATQTPSLRESIKYCWEYHMSDGDIERLGEIDIILKNKFLVNSRLFKPLYFSVFLASSLYCLGTIPTLVIFNSF
jgi:hypothetical protein